jgi:thiol-disulfide isomerase/thioredoxin
VANGGQTRGAGGSKRDEGGILGRWSYPVTVALLVLAGFFGLAVLPRVLAGTHAMVGKQVPAIALPVLWEATPGKAPGTPIGRAPLPLTSLKGNVVVLDFWAPWCGPCKHEMPVLDALARRMAKDGVIVVGVLVDPDHDGAIAVLRQLGIGYPQLEDTEGKAQHAFDVQQLPSLVVLDKQGNVVSFHTGFTTEEDLEADIKRAM